MTSVNASAVFGTVAIRLETVTATGDITSLNRKVTVGTLAAAIALTLPEITAGMIGQELIIQDPLGNADDTNTVTVTAATDEKISYTDVDGVDQEVDSMVFGNELNGSTVRLVVVEAGKIEVVKQL